MCRRCARVCQLRQGRDVLSIANRGFETKMMPSYGRLINLSVNHVAMCLFLSYRSVNNKRYERVPQMETQKFLQLVHIVGQAVR